MRTNIVRMREFDEAWNERRWVDYGDLLAERVLAFGFGSLKAQDKQNHIQTEIAFCQLYPDACRHINPYDSIFTSGDGRRTACVTRITGTRRQGTTVPTHEAPPTLEIRAAFICTWTSGAITELLQFR